MTIDLHLHSTASDGDCTPEEVVARAAARGVGVIALCDHDTVGGVRPAQQAGEALGVRVVPGVEITCFHQGRSLHLLGYGFAPDAPALLADLEHRRAVRRRHIDRILDKLDGLGIQLDRERLAAMAAHETIGRPHIAAAMVEAGHVPDTRAAFDRYLRRHRPAYVMPAEPQSPFDAIALLHRLDALAVLAHPALDQGHELVPALVAGGLDGVEAWHPAHTPGMTEIFLAEARKHGLLVTGGSDNHGPQRPPDIGEVAVPPEILDALDRALAR